MGHANTSLQRTDNTLEELVKQLHHSLVATSTATVSHPRFSFPVTPASTSVTVGVSTTGSSLIHIEQPCRPLCYCRFGGKCSIPPLVFTHFRNPVSSIIYWPAEDHHKDLILPSSATLLSMMTPWIWNNLFSIPFGSVTQWPSLHCHLRSTLPVIPFCWPYRRTHASRFLLYQLIWTSMPYSEPLYVLYSGTLYHLLPDCPVRP